MILSIIIGTVESAEHPELVTILKSMTRRIIIAILILAALAYIFRGCFKSDEDKIRDMLAESKAWAEKKDLLNLFNHFDKAFADDSGLTRDDIKVIAFRVFHQCEKVEVTYQEVSLSINEDHAFLVLNLNLYLTELGERREVFEPTRTTNRFNIKLSKKKGKWKFIESTLPEDIIKNGSSILDT